MYPFPLRTHGSVRLALAFVGATAAAAVLSSGCATTPVAQAESGRLPQKRPLVAVAPKLLFSEREVLGKYYFGDGLGVNCTLNLSADKRFDFAWSGCGGEYDRNVGTWQLKGDVLVLKPKLPYKREGFQGMDVRFIPVKWGARYLLIDENEMPGFCAMAAKSTPPSEGYAHGHDYVKSVSNAVSSQGKPLIPGRFRDFYRFGPVDARVIRIEKNGNVVLNKGSKERIKPRLLMAVEECERINLEILSVSEHESIARPIYFWNSDRRIKKGDLCTTGLEFSRPRGTGSQRLKLPPDEPKSKSAVKTKAIKTVRSVLTNKSA